MKLKISKIIGLFAIIIMSSCQEDIATQITNVNDYNNYLSASHQEALALTETKLAFWTKKLETSPNQFPFLSKIAGAHTEKFMMSGDIGSLKDSETTLLKLNKITKFTNASYLRALARNYISQHKFKEALEALLKAETNGAHLKATHSMLFDVHLELGNTQKAVYYLDEIKDFNSFDYLIRLSKYNDHQGDLQSAIRYLEKALVIAEASNLDATKQWTYTNLADYYGHAGKIKQSYQYYLKALAIDENDAYAKKGIAWIIYSYEQNPKEALRILNTVMQYLSLIHI